MISGKCTRFWDEDVEFGVQVRVVRLCRRIFGLVLKYYGPF